MPEKTRVGIHVLGGTGACDEFSLKDDHRLLPGEDDLPCKAVPVHGKIPAIIANDLSDETYAKYAFEISEAEKLQDSGKYKSSHLTNIVNNTRTRLEQSDCSQVLKVGSDNAAAVLQALAEGVPPELLGDRTIVAAVVQEHAHPNRPVDWQGRFYPKNTEIVRALENSIRLSSHRKELQKRIVLLCGSTLYPARGIVKTDANAEIPFIHRFIPLGHRDAKGEFNWKLDIESGKRPETMPRGNLDQPFGLASGIMQFDLNPSTHYGNFKKSFKGMLGGSKKSRKNFRGALITAPGRANLSQSPADLRHLCEAASYAADAGVPVFLASAPIQSRRPGRQGAKTAVYGGQIAALEEVLNETSGGSHDLIDGQDATVNELLHCMSQAVWEASQRGLYRRDRIEYVRAFFSRYMDFLAGSPKKNDKNP